MTHKENQMLQRQNSEERRRKKSQFKNPSFPKGAFQSEGNKQTTLTMFAHLRNQGHYENSCISEISAWGHLLIFISHPKLYL